MTRFQLWILVVSVGLPFTLASNILHSPNDLGLNLLGPPHITAPDSQSTEYLKKGSSLSLNCRATGNPTPTLEWRWNGQPIPSKADSRIQEFPGNGTLKIIGFQPDLIGYYQCRAVNKYGVSLSHIVEIRKRVDPVFGGGTHPDRLITVQEGHGTKLECVDRPVGIPPGPYRWYHVEEVEGNKQIQVGLTDRLDMDLNGTLYIIEAKKDDEADTYACAASSNDALQVSIAQTPYAEVKVTPGDGLPFKPVRLGYTGFTTADIGGDVTIECFFSGMPTPNITWTSGIRNTAIVNGMENRFRISSGGRKLKIEKVSDNDQGDYICEASNDQGSASAVTFLNVTSRPRFRTSSPELIVTPAGSSPTFTCVAHGALDELPVSRPQWTIDGDDVPLNAMKYNLSDDGTELTVIDVTKADMMCVQCNVTNSRGYAYGNGFLIVIDPLVVVTRPDPSIEIANGTSEVNLTIAALADACCPVEFSWSHNGRFLSKSDLRAHPYAYHPGRNRATLSVRLPPAGSSPEEALRVLGEYRCDVWHRAYAENASVVAVLRLQESKEPEKAAVKEAGMNLWWIGLLGGIIVLILAIVAIVLMIRYNYPRQEYLLEKAEKKHHLNPEKDMLDHSFEEI